MTEPNEDAVKHETVAADTETAAEDEASEAAAEDAGADHEEPAKRRVAWPRLVAFGVLPGLALVLALGAGYLKWADSTVRDSAVVRAESVRTAADSTIAMLSYKPDTVEKDLGAARDRLTGGFKDYYASLSQNVVIPGSKQKQISATATVPAAASVSASENHAAVLVYVDQIVVVGNDPPTNTASSVRVTLDKIDGRWLISQFEPV